MHSRIFTIIVIIISNSVAGRKLTCLECEGLECSRPAEVACPSNCCYAATIFEGAKGWRNVKGCADGVETCAEFCAAKGDVYCKSCGGASNCNREVLQGTFPCYQCNDCHDVDGDTAVSECRGGGCCYTAYVQVGGTGFKTVRGCNENCTDSCQRVRNKFLLDNRKGVFGRCVSCRGGRCNKVKITGIRCYQCTGNGCDRVKRNTSLVTCKSNSCFSASLFGETGVVYVRACAKSRRQNCKEFIGNATVQQLRVVNCTNCNVDKCNSGELSFTCYHCEHCGEIGNNTNVTQCPIGGRCYSGIWSDNKGGFFVKRGCDGWERRTTCKVLGLVKNCKVCKENRCNAQTIFIKENGYSGGPVLTFSLYEKVNTGPPDSGTIQKGKSPPLEHGSSDTGNIQNVIDEGVNSTPEEGDTNENGKSLNLKNGTHEIAKSSVLVVRRTRKSQLQDSTNKRKNSLSPDDGTHEERPLVDSTHEQNKSHPLHDGTHDKHPSNHGANEKTKPPSIDKRIHDSHPSVESARAKSESHPQHDGTRDSHPSIHGSHEKATSPPRDNHTHTPHPLVNSTHEQSKSHPLHDGIHGTHPSNHGANEKTKPPSMRIHDSHPSVESARAKSESHPQHDGTRDSHPSIHGSHEKATSLPRDNHTHTSHPLVNSTHEQSKSHPLHDGTHATHPSNHGANEKTKPPSIDKRIHDSHPSVESAREKSESHPLHDGTRDSHPSIHGSHEKATSLPRDNHTHTSHPLVNSTHEQSKSHPLHDGTHATHPSNHGANEKTKPPSIDKRIHDSHPSVESAREKSESHPLHDGTRDSHPSIHGSHEKATSLPRDNHTHTSHPLVNSTHEQSKSHPLHDGTHATHPSNHGANEKTKPPSIDKRIHDSHPSVESAREKSESHPLHDGTRDSHPSIHGSHEKATSPPRDNHTHASAPLVNSTHEQSKSHPLHDGTHATHPSNHGANEKTKPPSIDKRIHDSHPSVESAHAKSESHPLHDGTPDSHLSIHGSHEKATSPPRDNHTHASHPLVNSSHEQSKSHPLHDGIHGTHPSNHGANEKTKPPSIDKRIHDSHPSVESARAKSESHLLHDGTRDSHPSIHGSHEKATSPPRDNHTHTPHPLVNITHEQSKSHPLHDGTHGTHPSNHGANETTKPPSIDKRIHDSHPSVESARAKSESYTQHDGTHDSHPSIHGSHEKATSPPRDNHTHASHPLVNNTHEQSKSHPLHDGTHGTHPSNHGANEKTKPPSMRIHDSHPSVESARAKSESHPLHDGTHGSSPSMHGSNKEVSSPPLDDRTHHSRPLVGSPYKKSKSQSLYKDTHELMYASHESHPLVGSTHKNSESHSLRGGTHGSHPRTHASHDKDKSRPVDEGAHHPGPSIHGARKKDKSHPLDDGSHAPHPFIHGTHSESHHQLSDASYYHNTREPIEDTIKENTLPPAVVFNCYNCSDCNEVSEDTPTSVCTNRCCNAMTYYSNKVLIRTRGCLDDVVDCEGFCEDFQMDNQVLHCSTCDENKCNRGLFPINCYQCEGCNVVNSTSRMVGCSSGYCYTAVLKGNTVVRGCVEGGCSGVRKLHAGHPFSECTTCNNTSGCNSEGFNRGNIYCYDCNYCDAITTITPIVQSLQSINRLTNNKEIESACCYSAAVLSSALGLVRYRSSSTVCNCSYITQHLLGNVRDSRVVFCAVCTADKCNHQRFSPTMVCYSCRNCKGVTGRTKTISCPLASCCYTAVLKEHQFKRGYTVRGCASWSVGELCDDTCRKVAQKHQKYHRGGSVSSCTPCMEGDGAKCNNKTTVLSKLAGKSKFNGIQCYECNGANCTGVSSRTRVVNCLSKCCYATTVGDAHQRGCMQGETRCDDVCSNTFYKINDLSFCKTCSRSFCNNHTLKAGVECYSCRGCSEISLKTPRVSCIAGCCYVGVVEDYKVGGVVAVRGCYTGDCSDTCQIQTNGGFVECHTCNEGDVGGCNHQTVRSVIKCYSCRGCIKINSNTPQVGCIAGCCYAANVDGMLVVRGCYIGDCSNTCRVLLVEHSVGGLVNCSTCKEGDVDGCNHQSFQSPINCYDCRSCNKINLETPRVRCLADCCYVAHVRDHTMTIGGIFAVRGCSAGDCSNTCQAVEDEHHWAHSKGGFINCSTCTEDDADGCNNATFVAPFMCYSCSSCNMITVRTPTVVCESRCCYAASVYQNGSFFNSRGCAKNGCQVFCEDYEDNEEVVWCKVCGSSGCNTHEFDDTFYCYSCEGCERVGPETGQVVCEERCCYSVGGLEGGRGCDDKGVCGAVCKGAAQCNVCKTPWCNTREVSVNMVCYSCNNCSSVDLGVTVDVCESGCCFSVVTALAMWRGCAEGDCDDICTDYDEDEVICRVCKEDRCNADDYKQYLGCYSCNCSVVVASTPVVICKTGYCFSMSSGLRGCAKSVDVCRDTEEHCVICNTSKCNKGGFDPHFFCYSCKNCTTIDETTPTVFCSTGCCFSVGTGFKNSRGCVQGDCDVACDVYNIHEYCKTCNTSKCNTRELKTYLMCYSCKDCSRVSSDTPTVVCEQSCYSERLGLVYSRGCNGCIKQYQEDGFCSSCNTSRCNREHLEDTFMCYSCNNCSRVLLDTPTVFCESHCCYEFNPGVRGCSKTACGEVCSNRDGCLSCGSSKCNHHAWEWHPVCYSCKDCYRVAFNTPTVICESNCCYSLILDNGYWRGCADDCENMCAKQRGQLCSTCKTSRCNNVEVPACYSCSNCSTVVTTTKTVICESRCCYSLSTGFRGCSKANCGTVCGQYFEKGIYCETCNTNLCNRGELKNSTMCHSCTNCSSTNLATTPTVQCESSCCYSVNSGMQNWRLCASPTSNCRDICNEYIEDGMYCKSCTTSVCNREIFGPFGCSVCENCTYIREDTETVLCNPSCCYMAVVKYNSGAVATKRNCFTGKSCSDTCSIVEKQFLQQQPGAVLTTCRTSDELWDVIFTCYSCNDCFVVSSTTAVVKCERPSCYSVMFDNDTIRRGCLGDDVDTLYTVCNSSNCNVMDYRYFTCYSCVGCYSVSPTTPVVRCVSKRCYSSFIRSKNTITRGCLDGPLERPTVCNISNCNNETIQYKRYQHYSRKSGESLKCYECNDCVEVSEDKLKDCTTCCYRALGTGGGKHVRGCMPNTTVCQNTLQKCTIDSTDVDCYTCTQDKCNGPIECYTCLLYESAIDGNCEAGEDSIVSCDTCCYLTPFSDDTGGNIAKRGCSPSYQECQQKQCSINGDTVSCNSCYWNKCNAVHCYNCDETQNCNTVTDNTLQVPCKPSCCYVALVKDNGINKIIRGCIDRCSDVCDDLKKERSNVLVRYCRACGGSDKSKNVDFSSTCYDCRECNEVSTATTLTTPCSNAQCCYVALIRNTASGNTETVRGCIQECSDVLVDLEKVDRNAGNVRYCKPCVAGDGNKCNNATFSSTCYDCRECNEVTTTIPKTPCSNEKCCYRAIIRDHPDQEYFAKRGCYTDTENLECTDICEEIRNQHRTQHGYGDTKECEPSKKLNEEIYTPVIITMNIKKCYTCMEACNKIPTDLPSVDCNPACCYTALVTKIETGNPYAIRGCIRPSSTVAVHEDCKETCNHVRAEHLWRYPYGTMIRCLPCDNNEGDTDSTCNDHQYILPPTVVDQIQKPIKCYDCENCDKVDKDTPTVRCPLYNCCYYVKLKKHFAEKSYTTVRGCIRWQPGELCETTCVDQEQDFKWQYPDGEFDLNSCGTCTDNSSKCNNKVLDASRKMVGLIFNCYTCVDCNTITGTTPRVQCNHPTCCYTARFKEDNMFSTIRGCVANCMDTCASVKDQYYKEHANAIALTCTTCQVGDDGCNNYTFVPSSGTIQCYQCDGDCEVTKIVQCESTCCYSAYVREEETKPPTTVRGCAIDCSYGCDTFTHYYTQMHPNGAVFQCNFCGRNNHNYCNNANYEYVTRFTRNIINCYNCTDCTQVNQTTAVTSCDSNCYTDYIKPFGTNIRRITARGCAEDCNHKQTSGDILQCQTCEGNICNNATKIFQKCYNCTNCYSVSVHTPTTTCADAISCYTAQITTYPLSHYVVIRGCSDNNNSCSSLKANHRTGSFVACTVCLGDHCNNLTVTTYWCYKCTNCYTVDSTTPTTECPDNCCYTSVESTNNSAISTRDCAAVDNCDSFCTTNKLYYCDTCKTHQCNNKALIETNNRCYNCLNCTTVTTDTPTVLCHSNCCYTTILQHTLGNYIVTRKCANVKQTMTCDDMCGHDKNCQICTGDRCNDQTIDHRRFTRQDKNTINCFNCTDCAYIQRGVSRIQCVDNCCYTTVWTLNGITSNTRQCATLQGKPCGSYCAYQRKKVADSNGILHHCNTCTANNCNRRKLITIGTASFTCYNSNRRISLCKSRCCYEARVKYIMFPSRGCAMVQPGGSCNTYCSYLRNKTIRSDGSLKHCEVCTTDNCNYVEDTRFPNEHNLATHPRATRNN